MCQEIHRDSQPESLTAFLLMVPTVTETLRVGPYGHPSSATWNSTTLSSDPRPAFSVVSHHRRDSPDPPPSWQGRTAASMGPWNRSGHWRPATSSSRDHCRQGPGGARERPRTDYGDFGAPSDIAAVVAFLASDKGRWVTAQDDRGKRWLQAPIALKCQKRASALLPESPLGIRIDN